MKPKVALVLLVVIVVVFIVAMSTNLFPKEKADKNKPPPDWVQAIQSKLVFHRPLDMRDVSAPTGCISGGALVIQAGSTCTYSIKASSTPARRLQLDQGIANATLYNGDTALPTQQLELSKPFDVMSGGGKLRIDCMGLNPCILHPV